MVKAILFDLDGTLLPMDNDIFTKTYFYHLSEAAKEWGYTDRDALIKAVWNGVKYMYANDGKVTNDVVFWKGFSDAYCKDCSVDSKKFDTFYSDGFTKAKAATFPAPLAPEAVRLAREKAEKVVLATNPIFPREAYRQRLSWIGLTMEDFDLVTDYENSRFTKPNTKYYGEILEKIGVDAKDAVMIGNDADEDMAPAMALGMKFFLQNDNVLNKSGREINCEFGGYEDMIKFLGSL